MRSTIVYITILVSMFCVNNNKIFSQTEENWVKLDSYDKLEGRWEGNAISGVKNIGGIEIELSLNISMTFRYEKNNKFVTSMVKYDFNSFLTDLENSKEMKEKHLTKEILYFILGIDDLGFTKMIFKKLAK